MVAAGLADRCEVHLAYCIGVPEPQALGIETFGTAKVAEDKIVAAIDKVFDSTPKAIIQALKLREVAYRPTAAYGAFGRTELNLPWEREDKVDALLDALGR